MVFSRFGEFLFGESLFDESFFGERRLSENIKMLFTCDLWILGYVNLGYAKLSWVNLGLGKTKPKNNRKHGIVSQLDVIYAYLIVSMNYK